MHSCGIIIPHSGRERHEGMPNGTATWRPRGSSSGRGEPWLTRRKKGAILGKGHRLWQRRQPDTSYCGEYAGGGENCYKIMADNGLRWVCETLYTQRLKEFGKYFRNIFDIKFGKDAGNPLRICYASAIISTGGVCWTGWHPVETLYAPAW